MSKLTQNNTYQSSRDIRNYHSVVHKNIQSNGDGWLSTSNRCKLEHFLTSSRQDQFTFLIKTVSTFNHCSESTPRSYTHIQCCTRQGNANGTVYPDAVEDIDAYYGDKLWSNGGW